MYYRVEDYDGLGQRSFTAAWTAEETRSRIARLGGIWDPRGGPWTMANITPGRRECQVGVIRR